MPNITIEGPPLRDMEKKRVLVREITGAAAKAFGLPAQTIVILIKENPPENVGIGGQLLADR